MKLSQETKHLLKWQFEWLIRFLRTTYHLLNRRAYKSWKENRNRDKWYNSEWSNCADFCVDERDYP